jgi:flagellar motor switch protein FliN
MAMLAGAVSGQSISVARVASSAQRRFKVEGLDTRGKSTTEQTLTLAYSDGTADVTVELAVEIGRTQMTIRETLALGPGSIVTLNRLAGEPVDLLVNGTPIARGEVVVIDRVRPARHRGRLERDRGAGRRARRRAGRRADRPAGLAAAAGSSTHSGGPDYAGLCAEPPPTTA